MTIVLLFFFFFLFVQWRVWGFFDLANPIVFMLNYHLMFLSLGVFVYYFNVYPAYSLEEVTLALCLGSYCLTVLAALVVYYLLGSIVGMKLKSDSLHRFSADTSGRANYLADFFWLCGVSLTIVVALKSGFSALSSMFSGESFEDERVAAVSGNGVLVVPAQVFLLVSTAWIMSRIDRGVLAKVFFFAGAAICMISFGFRSGVAFLMLISVLFYFYSRFGRLPVLKSVLFCFFALSFFVLMGVLRKGGGEQVLDRFLASFFWRSFVTLHNLDVILNGYRDFLHGGGVLMELAVLIPGPDINLGEHLKVVLGYDFPGGGITPSYIGTGFVDFGIFGALLYPFITGGVVATAYVLWPLLVGRSKFSFLMLLVFSVTTSGVSAAGFVSPYVYFGIPLVLLGVCVRLFFMLAIRR